MHLLSGASFFSTRKTTIRNSWVDAAYNQKPGSADRSVQGKCTKIPRRPQQVYILIWTPSKILISNLNCPDLSFYSSSSFLPFPVFFQLSQLKEY